MPTMSTELLAAIRASLANTAHAWTLQSYLETGDLAGDYSANFRLYSAPLKRHLVVLASVNASTGLDHLDLIWLGTSFRTDDSDLYDDLAALVGDFVDDTEAAVIAALGA